jgi:hypothetical protein
MIKRIILGLFCIFFITIVLIMAQEDEPTPESVLSKTNVYAIAWSANGQYIAVSSGSYRCSNTVKLIEIISYPSGDLHSKISFGGCTIKSLD